MPSPAIQVTLLHSQPSIDRWHACTRSLPLLNCLQRFATERREMQASLDEQRLKVAELEGANTGVDSTCRETEKVCSQPKYKADQHMQCMLHCM